MVERFPEKEEVNGSIPFPTTNVDDTCASDIVNVLVPSRHPGKYMKRTVRYEAPISVKRRLSKTQCIGNALPLSGHGKGESVATRVG